jgi:hypothetical protein
MLEAVPSRAAYLHDAFALAPPELQRAREIAARAAGQGWASARASLFEWAAAPAQPAPVVRTQLDPTWPRLAAGLEAAARRAPSRLRARLRAAHAAFAAAPREVAIDAEAQAAWAAARLARMIEERAPRLLLDAELDILEDALAGLDSGLARDDDQGGAWLGDILRRVARYDLSLGPRTETLALLSGPGGPLGSEPMESLRGSTPLARWPRAGTDDFDAILGLAADDLRHWRQGPPPVQFAAACSALALSVARTPRPLRVRIASQLDADDEPALAGRDYVASLAQHLERLSERATLAEREGLVVVSREVASSSGA